MTIFLIFLQFKILKLIIGFLIFLFDFVNLDFVYFFELLDNSLLSLVEFFLSFKHIDQIVSDNEFLNLYDFFCQISSFLIYYEKTLYFLEFSIFFLLNLYIFFLDFYCYLSICNIDSIYFSSNIFNSTISLEYFRIFIIFFFSLILSLIIFGLSYFLVYQDVDVEKISAYECGFQPFEDARSKFDIRFYLVAILFIIFDLEIMFLFPWSLSLSSLGFLGFFSMFLFLIILTIGFLYEWKKKALDW